MSDIKQELLNYNTFLKKIRSQANDQMANMPAGKLQVYRDKKIVRYYYSEKGTRKYLRKKDMKTIQELAQKFYAKSVCRKTDSQIKLINQFLKKFDPAVIKSVHAQLIPEYLELINPYYEDDEAFLIRWINQPYEGNKYKPEEKNICTNNKELVRSKGEKILADKLRDMGIPYKYECPLELKGYGCIYPDFTIMNMQSRKEVYIELFGMMDNPDYCASALKKIDLYARNSIIPGENLICIFESSKKVFDTSILEIYIGDILR